nr:hypothetical protein HUO10_006174 [Paraburkholderia busanensis]
MRRAVHARRLTRTAPHPRKAPPDGALAFARKFLLSNLAHLGHHIGIAAAYKFGGSGSRYHAVRGATSAGHIQIAPRAASAEARSGSPGQFQPRISAPPPTVRPPLSGDPVTPAMRRLHSPSRVVQLSVQLLRAHGLSDISAFLLHRIRDFARRAQALATGPVPTFFHGGAPRGCCAARPAMPRLTRVTCRPRNTGHVSHDFSCQDVQGL